MVPRDVISSPQALAEQRIPDGVSMYQCTRNITVLSAEHSGAGACAKRVSRVTAIWTRWRPCERATAAAH